MEIIFWIALGFVLFNIVALILVTSSSDWDRDDLEDIVDCKWGKDD
tara:strand:- start:8467 stop:8604 length:138 start_codon:yes stop_codon:yes gene_type:complete